MPTYQYECDACGHHFEHFQSMLDKKLKKCPKCGKNKLHRLIGAGSGIIFKGSGSYETDYKKKAPSAKETGKTELKSDKEAAPAGAKTEAVKKESGGKTGSAEKKVKAD